jgi:starch phosphorylase
MLGRLSIIEEGEPKKIRMAYLAMVGSFSVNGVSRLHSELLKTRVLSDFYAIYPEKFNNKTNGITQRRWLLKSNPALAELINQHVGDRWIKKLDHLEKLMPLAEDERFRVQWQHVKAKNKKILAEQITKSTGVLINPESLFDVQIKRIHEYKRQLLFGFYIIGEYLQLKNNPQVHRFPRTYILGGKAAPGYYMAKLIIKFLNNVADVINHDRSIHDQIKMVFLENYRVSLAERIFPASDLSEQISTAGTEASGTGNMKFMLNGALTIGTLDGANIEMLESVGKDNIFIFGHKTEDIERLKEEGYNPQRFIHQSPILEEVVSAIKNGMFSAKEQGIFTPLIENAFYKDPFQICADFDSYFATQQAISELYKNNPKEWTRKSIINVAKTGMFSSDRTIKEYAREIWDIPVSEG